MANFLGIWQSREGCIPLKRLEVFDCSIGGLRPFRRTILGLVPEFISLPVVDEGSDEEEGEEVEDGSGGDEDEGNTED